MTELKQKQFTSLAYITFKWYIYYENQQLLKVTKDMQHVRAT